MLEPSDPDLRHTYASVLYELGDAKEAKKQYREAIRLRENSPQTYYSLALVPSDRGATDEAERAYCNALRWDDKFAEAYNNLAVIYLNRHKKREATEYFRKARDLFDARHDTNQVARVDGILEQLDATIRKSTGESH